jgi:hypothetical protein
LLSIFGEEKDGGEDWQGLKPHDILEVFGGPAEAVPLLQNNIGYGFENNIVSKQHRVLKRTGCGIATTA